MKKENQTSETDFIFIGFSYLPHLRSLLFFIFLLLYTFTLLGNAITILIICLNLQLHTPMYFFLANLSFLDIFNTSVTIPKMLISDITKKQSISYTGCITQLFLFTSLASAECVLLAVMAYDRYLAICYPLHYMEVMNNKVCVLLATLAWLGGFLQSTVHTIFTFQLSFCQPRLIDGFFCEVPSLLKLSCSLTFLNEVVLFCFGGLVSLTPFLLTFISYTVILLTVFNIPSSEGRSKAFSTCGSHLTVVAMFYGAATFVYFRPTSSYSLPVDRLVSVFYSLLTPMVNPVIYSLKNNDVKGALKKMFEKKRSYISMKIFSTSLTLFI
ncbi:olfactory receptor 1019-like [Bombina bombina]|uniref:olfactory receptor 1019-like n=1 Tax=Bombina bombina TaxID=8345 RepID=UPI00235A7841|nr:olfactory receptor 1019-like [Bombina bombina]